MKRPIFIALAIVLGIIATNLLVKPQNSVDSQLVEDSVGTGMAAPKQVNGDIPL